MIQTQQDSFQWRVTRILNAVNAEAEMQDFSDIHSFLNTTDGKILLADLLIDDIEIYCGIDEALKNEY